MTVTAPTHSASSAEQSAAGPTGGPGKADRIVVGIDGSPSSVTALRWALQEGSLRHVGVHVVLAWAMPPVVGMAPVILPTGYDLQAEARTQLDTVLRAQNASIEGRPADSPLTWEVLERSPAAGLLAAAAEGASLLVVGSRGHGGFVGLLLGSVSQQCAAHARCPVVVVHDS